MRCRGRQQSNGRQNCSSRRTQSAVDRTSGKRKDYGSRTDCKIAPPMTLEESMEITKIYGITKMLDPKEPLVDQAPVSQCTSYGYRAALSGGGMIPAPGEITLAHGGVLFFWMNFQSFPNRYWRCCVSRWKITRCGFPEPMEIMCFRQILF